MAPRAWFLLVLILTGLTAHPARAKVIVEEKSLYRNVLVYEENGLRCMKFGKHDNGRQACIALDNPEAIVFNSPKMQLGALYLNPSPRNALIIGLGGGIVTVALQKMYPDIQIDNVEIDPAVVRVSQQFFNFTPSKNTHIYTDDGRVFVKQALKRTLRYDIIFLDAFDHLSVPEHMTTREYLLELKELLAPGGVMAANTFSSGQLHAAESATYADVFGPYYNLQVHNRVILTRLGGLPGMDEVRRNAGRMKERLEQLSIDTNWLLSLFSTEVAWPERTRLLTDQYSPSNLLNGRPLERTP
ncbi:MAG: fused MFS/spermidine synthase [Magnetococcales bacterium]|nr:fused MFS/spermidine synthase [Magnetococcales bacterium]MBF0261111.1 fused MFS/spermidine synthase [Magnetococcales bacterium]